MSGAVVELARALVFAAEAHANQRRKGAAQEPYLNHLVEVMEAVARTTGGTDTELLIAALLHDVVEDTPVTEAALAAAFGPRVAAIVAECSDDMSLPKEARRRARIEAMPRKTPEARMVKTADAISNLRAIALSPPAGWGADRKLGYLEGCRQMIGAARGVNAALEAEFDRIAAETERAIRDRAERSDAPVRALEGAIGQPVHLVYLANTECRALGEADVERLAGVIARSFPSATIQEAQAIFEGRRRPVLVARLRTDSTEAVVALAQRLCLDFGERFVGIETAGRYVRVYADDTG